MRYSEIAPSRERGRRESFGPRRRIAVNDLRYDTRTGMVIPTTRALKAQRPMHERWLFMLNSADHPIARLWRKFMKEVAPNFKHGPVSASAPGWKSFKKRAHAEGNAYVARAMAR